MPNANGQISSPDGRALIGSFFVDDVVHNFIGSFNVPVGPFTSNNAEVTYDNVDQLTSGPQNFDAIISPNEIKFSDSNNNGPLVSGPTKDGFEIESRTSGFGIWSQN